MTMMCLHEAIRVRGTLVEEGVLPRPSKDLLAQWIGEIGAELEAASLDFVLEPHAHVGEMVPTGSGEMPGETTLAPPGSPAGTGSGCTKADSSARGAAAAGTPRTSAPLGGDDEPVSRAPGGDMVSDRDARLEAQVWEALSAVRDPRSLPAPSRTWGSSSGSPWARTGCEVDLLPTFAGCPALDVIREDVAGGACAYRRGRRAVRSGSSISPPWTQ